MHYVNISTEKCHFEKDEMELEKLSHKDRKEIYKKWLSFIQCTYI